MKLAFIFSGQGAQAAGMGKSLCDGFPVCRRTFEEADEALGFSLSRMCFEGDSVLNDTEYAQPAILTHSIAAFRLLAENGIAPSCAAGLSLGEYSALTAAGVFGFADAVRLVRRRGQFMAETAGGAMSAILGLSDALAEQACAEFTTETESVVCANYNAPGQLVISGGADAVARAEALCLAAGAKRAVRLQVSGAFHSPYMRPAAEKLAPVLLETPVAAFTFPVVTNVSARVIPAPDAVCPLLLRQIQSPVLWTQSVQTLLSLGAEAFVELGPGRTLSALVKKCAPGVRVYNVEDAPSFAKTMAALESGVEV